MRERSQKVIEKEQKKILDMCNHNRDSVRTLSTCVVKGGVEFPSPDWRYLMCSYERGGWGNTDLDQDAVVVGQYELLAKLLFIYSTHIRVVPV